MSGWCNTCDGSTDPDHCHRCCAFTRDKVEAERDEVRKLLKESEELHASRVMSLCAVNREFREALELICRGKSNHSCRWCGADPGVAHYTNEACGAVLALTPTEAEERVKAMEALVELTRTEPDILQALSILAVDSDAWEHLDDQVEHMVAQKLKALKAIDATKKGEASGS